MNEMQPPGTISVSLDAILQVTNEQLSAANQETARWRAAYNELVQRATQDVMAAQVESVRWRSIAQQLGYIEPGPVPVDGVENVQVEVADVQQAAALDVAPPQLRAVESSDSDEGQAPDMSPKGRAKERHPSGR